MALDDAARRSHHSVMELDRHLVDGYRESLRRYVAPRLSNKSDVDDIVQDTFIKYHSYTSECEIASPINYMIRIANNLINDRGRRRSPLRDAVDIDGVSEDYLRLEPAQEHGRCYFDLQSAYHSALAELPLRRREVYRLRRHEAMTTPEVAATLSITPRMVQKHMTAVMVHLQDRLGPFLSDGGSASGSGSHPPVNRQTASSSR